MRKLCLLPLLLLFGLFTSNQIIAQDSTKAALQISILTCAPGEDVYTAWGHTAIRIIDSAKQTDVVYNFGTFDFNTPNFLVEFVKGNLNYFLSADYFQNFIAEYQYYGRSIKEQVLILTDAEKIKWQNALQKNLEGNNRYYLYNFITDNCTTRVKDGFYQFATTQVPPSNIKSFRTHVVEAPYQQGIPWIGLGIDLLLGAVSDQAPTAMQAGFLPDLFFDQLAAQPGHIATTQNYDFTRTTGSKPTDPIYYIIGLILVYLFVGKWNARWAVIAAKFLDITLLFIYGLGGLLLVYMSLFSLHTACHNNYNIAWIHPLYWIALVFYFMKPIWAGYLGRIFFIASIGLIVVSYLLPQSFSNSVYLLMGLSLVLNYRLIKRGIDAKFN
ncbi:MAG: DUF4105 domain-containing protein [Chitinophagaceae bacterium]|nr:DUF4105 domain-containing protein [Chitinophagaceae bacterium]